MSFTVNTLTTTGMRLSPLLFISTVLAVRENLDFTESHAKTPLYSTELSPVSQVTSQYSVQSRSAPRGNSAGDAADSTKSTDMDLTHSDTISEDKKSFVYMPSTPQSQRSYGSPSYEKTGPTDNGTNGAVHTLSVESNVTVTNSADTTPTNIPITYTHYSDGFFEVIYTSPKSGCVQTITDLASQVDGFIRMHVPSNHWLMVSMPLLRTNPWEPITCLQLYVGSRRHWTLYNNFYPETELLYTSVFVVWLRFENGRSIIFRLQFSFHEHTALPQKLPEGRWNCSVPHWPDFEQHLSCNFHRECEAGEDETGCEYESPFCGPGLVSTEYGCYMYIESKKHISWYEAAATCKQKGGYLTSLNTPEEWLAMTKLLQRAVVRTLYVGLITQNPSLPTLYRRLPSWEDGTVAYYRHTNHVDSSECNILSFGSLDSDFMGITGGHCRNYNTADILCEMEKDSSPRGKTSAVDFPNVTSTKTPLAPVTSCPAGHQTHTAFACDAKSVCWGLGYGPMFTCVAPMTSLPPLFVCANAMEFVPFSLVCDFRLECTDGSDENFCVFPPCGLNEFHCGNQQCIPSVLKCDDNHMENCVNGFDEQLCGIVKDDLISHEAYPLPYVIRTVHNSVDLSIEPVQHFQCNVTFFPCHTTEYCLSVELRCNGIYDCPGREDEVGCDSCPGLYRCRSSLVCIHPDMMCDGIYQCPRRDDELFCRRPCPSYCTCYALSAFCSHRFSVHEISDLRFLEAPGSGMTLVDVTNMTVIVHLGLRACGLRHLDTISLPNLQYLDLRDNFLKDFQDDFLHMVPNLKELILDGNPLNFKFVQDTNISHTSYPTITTLGLSRVFTEEFDVGVLTVFPQLQILNLSGSGIQEISSQGFPMELNTLDLRKCSLTIFPSDLIRNLHNLRLVFADNYKLCCPAMLPEGFNIAHCHAPRDEISSCDNLLRSDAYRVLLSVFATMAILGNFASFIYRVLINKSRNDLGFGVFVTHLSLSDLMMGVYLAVIGVADRVYLGSYLWGDVTWKRSAFCSMAGFMSLLSCEVSAFIICLITLDRFLVLRFPFSQLRFRRKSAHAASGFVWTVGMMLGAIPLLPVTSHWEFYQQNGICLPLPITQRQFPGHAYSFSVMIVLNLVLFLLIGFGQLRIYYTVKTSSMAGADSDTKSKDMAVARRLITIAVSDFLCWFPIGVLGLLASTGTRISGEVSVAMAILALPLNAALNPFIYTYNMVVERSQREKEKRLLKVIMATTHGNREDHRSPIP